MTNQRMFIEKQTLEPEENEEIGPYKIGKCISRTKFSLVYGGSFITPGETEWSDLAFKFVKRFTESKTISREIEFYQSLKSDHVVPLLDHFEYREFHCLVFPYASGQDLELYMHKHYPLGVPESVVKYISSQLFEGLAFCHARGVVHCDIKLANILVPNPDLLEPKIWLCDFGFSRPVDEAQVTPSIIGTSEYESPEIQQRKGCMFLFLILSLWNRRYLGIWCQYLSAIGPRMAISLRNI
jgi:serine/threonine protein kinase